MKKFVLTMFALCAMVLVSSCSSDDGVAESKDDMENRAKKLGFMTIAEQLKDSATRVGELTRENSSTKNTSVDNFVIFKARIARASKGCLTGFGLCDIIIFGKRYRYYDFDEAVYNSPDYVEGILREGKDGNSYVDLKLAKDPKSEDISEMPLFNVDEEIEKIYQNGDSTITVVVPSNGYVYDRNIGVNGGYRVEVKTEAAVKAIGCDTLSVLKQ